MRDYKFIPTAKHGYNNYQGLPALGSRPGPPSPISMVTLRPKPATVYTGPLPTMVPCTPYKAKLTEKACALRYTLANSTAAYQPSSDRTQFAMKDRHTYCTGCPTGKQRKQGLEDEESNIDRPGEEVSSPSEVGRRYPVRGLAIGAGNKPSNPR